MNKLIKILSVVGLGATLTCVSMAQGAGPAGGNVTPTAQAGPAGQRKAGGQKAMMELQAKILKQLNLTADQETQIKALDKKTMGEIKDFRKENKGAGGNPTDKNDPARTALREKLKAITKAHHDGLMAILTPDQQKQYQTLMKQAMQELRNKKGNRPPQP